VGEKGAGITQGREMMSESEYAHGDAMRQSKGEFVMMTEETMSNRLPVLAAEIRRAHADVQEIAKTAAERAITAGKALIEAKELVKHGEWLPWLREHCAMPERTAQLYMSVARSGLPAEAIAAIGLKGAANSIEIELPYDPFYGCLDEEMREWHLYAIFMSARPKDSVGWECGMWRTEDAGQHCEWLKRNNWMVPDWLGVEGDAWREIRGMPWKAKARFIDYWNAFLAAHQGMTDTEIKAEAERVAKWQQTLPLDAWQSPPAPKRKRQIRNVA
jgi:hypothetical protein